MGLVEEDEDGEMCRLAIFRLLGLVCFVDGPLAVVVAERWNCCLRSWCCASSIFSRL